ncbi:MAG: GrpB family protein [Candidatus Rickettsiella isopodorum]
MINYKTGSAKSIQLNAKDNLTIEPYNPVWPKLAGAEIKTIKGMAGQLSYISIEHIGNTVVAGLSSKPIIDILITVQSITEANHWVKPLETLAYVFSKENSDKSHWIFSKGMPPFGEKRTHNVHIVESLQ